MIKLIIENVWLMSVRMIKQLKPRIRKQTNKTNSLMKLNAIKHLTKQSIEQINIRIITINANIE